MKASVIKIMTKLYSSITTMQKITPVKPPNLVHRLFLVEECHSHKLKAIFLSVMSIVAFNKSGPNSLMKRVKSNLMSQLRLRKMNNSNQAGVTYKNLIMDGFKLQISGLLLQCKRSVSRIWSGLAARNNAIFFLS